MSNSPVIEFDQVCFSYGKSEVLHNVDFSIYNNDFVAVVGPNGGGKTTLIKLILGLLKPLHGTIRLFGQNPRLTRDQVGYVPQVFQYDHRFPVRVRDVVRMGRVGLMRMGRFSKSDDNAVKEALTKTQALDLIRKPFSELSGGQRQRVLIAQALVSNPNLLLLDEPTANVDSTVEKELFELFNELNKQLPMMMVSHNLNVVTRHASHILCVNRTAELQELNAISSSLIHSAQGADLAMIIHNQECPVHDASHIMQTEHEAQFHRKNQ